MRKEIQLVLALLFCRGALAAIPMPPQGFGPLAFTNPPSNGEFSTYSMPGQASSLTSAAALDAAVQTNSATFFTNSLLLDSSPNPAAHTLASWSATREALYTSPAGVTAQMLLTSLRNESGSLISWLYIQYDFQSVGGAFTPAEIPGHRAFFSLSGQPGSWQLIPEFSGSTNSGTRSAVLNVGSWLPYADLYLLWAHDNAGHSPDAAYLIDNFAVWPEGPPMPPCIVVQPTNTTIVENEPVSFSVGMCNDVGISYQWFRNGDAIAGANSATLALTRVPLVENGSAYYVVVGNVAGMAQSATAILSVLADTNSPKVTVAFRAGETNSEIDKIRVVYSEPVETNSAMTLGNYAILYTSTLSPAAAVRSVTAISETEVELSIDSLVPGRQLTLRVQDMADRAANPNPLSPNPTYLPIHAWQRVLVGPDHVWRYFEPTNEVSVQGWRSRGYDDSHWRSGLGAFGFPTDERLSPPFEVRTAVAPPGGGGAMTTCYRTRFTLEDGATNVVLQFSGVFDDGAIVFLNDLEVWRVRLQAGAVTFATPAQNAPELDGHPLDLGEFYRNGALVSGTNVLAVQLHSVTPTSGDNVMALTLSALEFGLPDECPSSLRIQRGVDGEVTLTWCGGGTLQVSQSVGEGSIWQDLVTSSPFRTNSVAGSQFFRVRY